MKSICGIAAIILLIAGAHMIWRTTKSGRIFDCLEDSKTEGHWVHHVQDPRKFYALITCYIVAFTAVVLMLGWTAIRGQPTF
jgi:hypothetical protein